MIACLTSGVLVRIGSTSRRGDAGIEALRRTTRDEPDYDKLMRVPHRACLDEHGLKLARHPDGDRAACGPLDGARGVPRRLARGATRC